VLTPLVEQQIEAKAAEAGIPIAQAKQDLVREKQPMLRYTSPEQIGALAAFLCGDDAATITGTTLSIDGGWTAQ
jgi:3-hydroxybutyrate dehydrogenase